MNNNEPEYYLYVHSDEKLKKDDVVELKWIRDNYPLVKRLKTDVFVVDNDKPNDKGLYVVKIVGNMRNNS